MFGAQEGVDFISGPYTVIFPIGSTNASFDIAINVDNILENDELFQLEITSVTNGHSLGNLGLTFVTITDTTGMTVRQITTS